MPSIQLKKKSLLYVKKDENGFMIKKEEKKVVKRSRLTNKPNVGSSRQELHSTVIYERINWKKLTKWMNR